MVELSHDLYRGETVDPFRSVESGGSVASDDPTPARPQPGRVNVVPQRPERVLGQVYVPMNLPVVPTQLAAGQCAGRYRFASENDPCHAIMMLSATDIPARLPPWSRSARESQPAQQSRRRNYRQLGSQISMSQVCCEMGRPVSTGNSHAKLVTTRAT